MQVLFTLKCVAAWAAVLLLLPLIIFTLIISLMWKIVTSYYCKIFHQNFVRCYAVDKSIYCGLKKNNLVHGFNFVLKGKVNAEDFFNTFLVKVINVKDIKSDKDPHIRFYQSPIEFWGQLFFKTHGKILYENHVASITIPNDSSRNENIANWIAKPFKNDSPSWAMLFLTVEESDDVNFVFKLHHALGDGYSLLHIMDLLTNTSYKYQVKDFQDSSAEKVKIMFELPYRSLQFFNEVNSIRNERGYFRNQLLDKYFMATVSLPLQALKEIRRNTNVQFASLMMYLIKFAFNLHILTTKQPVKSFVIPLSFPWPNHPKTKLFNHFSGGVFNFKINSKIRVCSEELMEVDREYKAMHLKYVNRIVKWSSEICYHYPVIVNKEIIDKSRINKNATFFYSHMLGSESYNNLFNYAVKNVSMWGLTPSPGFWIYGLTTNNEVQLTITGPRISNFEPERFLQSVKESLKSLLSSCRENIIIT